MMAGLGYKCTSLRVGWGGGGGRKSGAGAARGRPPCEWGAGHCRRQTAGLHLRVSPADFGRLPLPAAPQGDMDNNDRDTVVNEFREVGGRAFEGQDACLRPSRSCGCSVLATVLHRRPISPPPPRKMPPPPPRTGRHQDPDRHRRAVPRLRRQPGGHARRAPSPCPTNTRTPPFSRPPFVPLSSTPTPRPTPHTPHPTLHTPHPTPHTANTPRPKVTLVVNYDIPVEKDGVTPAYDTYLHRIGRSGRFGRKGAAFNLICGSQVCVWGGGLGGGVVVEGH
jgi:hypothetical protein